MLGSNPAERLPILMATTRKSSEKKPAAKKTATKKAAPVSKRAAPAKRAATSKPAAKKAPASRKPAAKKSTKAPEASIPKTIWERNPGLEDEICERLSAGEPLRQICRDDHMPCWRSVYLRMEENDLFDARIARARVIGRAAIAEECLDIADDSTNDYMEKKSQDGGTYLALNQEHVQRSKLRIHTRLQLLAKWDPATYGERLRVGGDETAPPIKTSSVDASQLSNDVLQELMRARRNQSE